MLQRCEEVATLFLSGAYSAAAVNNDLRFAVQYKMARWQQRCLQLTLPTVHERVSLPLSRDMFEDIEDIAMSSAML